MLCLLSLGGTPTTGVDVIRLNLTDWDFCLIILDVGRYFEYSEYCKYNCLIVEKIICKTWNNVKRAFLDSLLHKVYLEKSWPYKMPTNLTFCLTRVFKWRRKLPTSLVILVLCWRDKILRAFVHIPTQALKSELLPVAIFFFWFCSLPWSQYRQNSETIFCYLYLYFSKIASELCIADEYSLVTFFF